jgi:amino acid transporter
MTRTLSLPVGFAVAFLWFVGIAAGIGFLAFSFASFVASSLESLGLPGNWAVTASGHVLLGLILIALIFWLHYAGARAYGAFVVLIFFIVLLAAIFTVGYGFATSPASFLDRIGTVLPSKPAVPAVETPSLAAFISVITLFMFAYGGITAATSLGGEAAEATTAMPRGIFWGWATALVLYTAVAAALFHAVPWWSVVPLIKSHHAELATTPGLIGLMAPRAVAAFINIIVMVIVGKTVAPQMLDSSRYLFAWAEDGLLPPALLHTNRAKAPDVALLVTALLGIVFLLEATYWGWAIGVTLRAMSLVLVFGIIGVGALNLRMNPAFKDVSWARQVSRHVDVPVAAVLAIIIAVVLLASVVVIPHTIFWLQPSVQGIIAVLIAMWIYGAAAARTVGLASRARALPIE